MQVQMHGYIVISDSVIYFNHLQTDKLMQGWSNVMYNKLDEHAFTAHARAILEYTGVELALRRQTQVSTSHPSLDIYQV